MDKAPHPALQKEHFEGNILPALALYREFIAEGMNQEQAIVETRRFLAIVAKRLRRKFQLQARAPFFFWILKRVLRPSMERNFPPPGFELEWPDLKENAAGFNLRRCFYVDVLSQLGAPELAQLFCEMDDITFERTPGIRWERQNTIARGGEFCDFRYYRE